MRMKLLVVSYIHKKNLLYRFLKITLSIAFRIAFRKIIIDKKEMLKENGPLLLACNHPNSFLDSVIIDILFDNPVWNLARGDAFINRRVSRLLKSLRILPIYRTSEGVENLSANYKTFSACMNIFQNNGIVMIFSEGKCEYEWHLRPLKKGTARLAMNAWQENIPLRVLPVGINYSSFSRFGKNVFIRFGNIISSSDVDWNATDGLRHQAFNNLLNRQLQQLVFEIGKNDKAKQKERLEIKQPLLVKILLAIPAIIGWLVHAPLYFPIKTFVKNKKPLREHYDAVLLGLLSFKYPFYLLFVNLLVYFFVIKIWWVFLLLLLMPFTAWSLVQLKGQLDR